MPQSVAPPHACVWRSPVGPLGLRLQGAALWGIDFLPPQTPGRAPQGPAGQAALDALQAYFAAPATACPVPLRPTGTAFQQRVWRALQRIPCGETRTYGGLAAQLQTSARAVGNACRANPLPILTPCHRVTSAQGPGGYAGAVGGKRLATKLWLLSHEGAPL